MDCSLATVLFLSEGFKWQVQLIAQTEEGLVFQIMLVKYLIKPFNLVQLFGAGKHWYKSY